MGADMNALKFGGALVAIVLARDVATAQPPTWAGGPTPPGQLFGYSPLVPTVDPFPTKTSGYAPSMFGPLGGRRVNPPLVVNPRRPSCPVVIEIRNGSRVPTGTNLAPAAPVVTTAAFVEGPIVRPLPATGLHRFER
jgi:hypothetical protein